MSRLPEPLGHRGSQLCQMRALPSTAGLPFLSSGIVEVKLDRGDVQETGSSVEALGPPAPTLRPHAGKPFSL